MDWHQQYILPGNASNILISDIQSEEKKMLAIWRLQRQHLLNGSSCQYLSSNTSNCLPHFILEFKTNNLTKAQFTIFERISFILRPLIYVDSEII